jgi:hypothetical protein
VKSLNDVNAIVNSMKQQFQDLVASVAKSTVDVIQLGFAELAKEVAKQSDAIAIMLTDAGWTPTMHVFMSDLVEFLERYLQDGIDAVQDELDHYLVKFYDQSLLEEILDVWSENVIIANRMLILLDVIHAHVKGVYNLSVPAILAQLEGLMADFYHHQGELRGKQLKAYYKTAVADDGKVSEQVLKFVDEVLLAHFKHGVPIQSSLSRHAILHGADVTYGNAINSLKLIVLFDYVQGRLNSSY